MDHAGRGCGWRGPFVFEDEFAGASPREIARFNTARSGP